MSSDNGVLASIPVSLVFEFGRIDVTADEVQQLAPGVILPVNRAPDEVFDIFANGKRIGSGELVRVGDGLAVRVTKINGNG